VMVSPRPARRPRPPIWVGGNSRAAVRRAARHGEGWVPWELTTDEFRTMAAFARRIRAEAVRPDDLELVAPISVPADAGGAAIADTAARWRDAGATAFHIGVGAGSFAEFLDRLTWTAEVMSRMP
jgi:alkanesulfonate monooxygenase SsuD/methylene tetrahydromethanopterin reductase-like flavin-dependent oxidoreductase (luciferase family)